MYDDKLVEVQHKLGSMVNTISRAILDGTKHYRKSDGAFLETVEEVIGALRSEGCVLFLFPEESGEPND